jgi:hypothetical protein
MVNSGKRKYTKKKVMKGGAISFSFIPFNKNGNQSSYGIYPKQGKNLLLFIDGTQDSFFNTYIRVKNLKSWSKVYFYLTDDGKRKEDPPTPFQLIYQTDNKVYQYNTTEVNRLRLVQQHSQMLYEDFKEEFKISHSTLGITSYGSNPNNSNPFYRQWDYKLSDAIFNGKISIDQLYFFLNDNPGKIVSNFWIAFKRKHNLEHLFL